MSDENTVESSTTESTATTPVNVETSAAEPENTDASTPKEHMIPKSRLDEVIGQKKEAARRADELAERVRTLEAEKNAAPPQPETQEPIVAPAHLSEAEQVRWLVEKHAGNLIKKELGMSLKDASTLLSTAQSTAKETAQVKYERLCSQHDLDPEDAEVQEFVYGLTQAKVPINKVFERAKKFYGKSNGTTEPVANVETSTVSPVMTQASKVPETVQEAVEMALRGEQAPHVPSMEIARRSKEKALAAAKE
jgi:hypothetical protein